MVLSLQRQRPGDSLGQGWAFRTEPSLVERILHSCVSTPASMTLMCEALWPPIAVERAQRELSRLRIPAGFIEFLRRSA